MLDDAEISRILSITAHPDDVDFAAAGTVARWTEAGIEVVYCVVTDGDAGGFDEDFPREEMPALRRAEQVAAAKCVGVHDVRFLGYPDGRVEATLDLRRDLARVIRQVRPDRFSAPARSGATPGSGSAIPTTARWARPPWTPSTRTRGTRSRSPSCASASRWPPGPCARSGSRRPDPNHYVDVTETFPRKIAALRAHESQTGHMEDLTERLRTRLTTVAEQRPARGHLAEGFRVLDTA